MTSTRDDVRRARNKLAQAKFHLGHLASAVQQERRVLLEVESFLGGCLGAAQSAFYILEKEAAEFKFVHAHWKSALSPAEREFVNRMMDERGTDVHSGSTTLHINLTVRPGDPEAYWDFRFKKYGGAVEITEACQRFIDLIERLVDQLEGLGKETRS
jgi:hypothetical protein